MRSVFPALHDQLLTKLLFGVVLIFLATLAAVSFTESSAEAQDAQIRPPLDYVGATPAVTN